MQTLLAWCAVGLAAGGPPAPTGKEIGRLIRELDSPKFEVRERASRRLLEIGRPAIRPLDDALAKMNPEGRLRAERILRQLDPARAALRRLVSPSVSVRREALLDMTGYRRAYLVEPLLKRLKEEDDRDCLRSVVQILGAQRDRRATQPLLAALSEPRPATVLDLLHHDILTALGEIADPAALEPLLRYRQEQTRPRRKDEKGRERTLLAGSASGNAALAKALGGTRAPRAVSVLLELSALAYDGSGGGVVDSAVSAALRRIGPAAVPHLTKAIRHKRDNVRTLIARVLGQIGDRRALPALTDMLKDELPWVGGAAAVALNRLGSDKGSAWILERVRDPKNPAWRDHEVSEALRALAECPHPSLRPFCERALRDGDRWEGFYAAECLARMGAEEGFAWLRGRLKDSKAVTFAIYSLSDLGDKKMVPDLIRLATDPGQDVVQAAIPALGRCGTRAAAEALLRLARGPEMARGYARLKRDAIRALGQIRTRKVAAALVELLSEPDDAVAGAAHWALAEIAGVNPGLSVARWRAWVAYHRDDLSAD
jgi:HEAT repeat protein